MLEIYNEEYKDLLGKGPPAGKKHQVCHISAASLSDMNLPVFQPLGHIMVECFSPG